MLTVIIILLYISLPMVKSNNMDDISSKPYDSLSDNPDGQYIPSPRKKKDKKSKKIPKQFQPSDEYPRCCIII